MSCSFSFSFFFLNAALTHSYVSYFAAYTLEEVDQKTKALRASANVSVGDDLSSSDVSML